VAPPSIKWLLNPLVAGGYIEIVHRQGEWYRLRPTPKGFATAL
jgi:hypothetical protein